jgi:hypothetical protein
LSAAAQSLAFSWLVRPAAIGRAVCMGGSGLTNQEKAKLWAAADKLRGHLDAAIR